LVFVQFVDHSRQILGVAEMLFYLLDIISVSVVNLVFFAVFQGFYACEVKFSLLEVVAG
jgi:hypothetical protein